VAGDTPTAQQVEHKLRQLCEHFVPGQYRLKVVNVLGASAELPSDLLAIPTIVRILPLPERKVIGDLSENETAARGLGFVGSMAC
jgi:circadian clock protein KaiB